MSNKNTAQSKAAKRTARAKVKSRSLALAKAAPQAIKQSKMRKAISQSGRVANFDAVLDQAVMDVKNGKEAVSEFKTTGDMIVGIKKAVGEVFKLYCYVTLALELIDSKVIQHDINLPLEEVSRVLMNIDTRIGVIEFMNKTPEEDRDNFAIETEALDIGTTLTSISEDLYEEVARLETHSLTIEETITRLADEIEEGELPQRRMGVLQSIAYKYLAELQLADAEGSKEVVTTTPLDEPAFIPEV